MIVIVASVIHAYAMPDAFAAAEAAVAAVIGDDAPFPHFDERQGHLRGRTARRRGPS